MLPISRIARRAALKQSVRKFSDIFENKNRIKEVRQKYYSKPASGKIDTSR